MDRRVLVGLLVCLAVWLPAGGPAVPQPPAPKVPEPGTAAQARAETLIKKLFHDEYRQARTDPAARRALAVTLLK
jgi:hypothetical protein